MISSLCLGCGLPEHAGEPPHDDGTVYCYQEDGTLYWDEKVEDPFFDDDEFDNLILAERMQGSVFHADDLGAKPNTVWKLVRRGAFPPPSRYVREITKGGIKAGVQRVGVWDAVDLIKFARSKR